MKGGEADVKGSLLCGQIQALPGPCPQSPREAGVRPFPEERATRSEPLCSSEAGSHPRPRGKTKRQGGPGWGRAATAGMGGGSESIFIVGRAGTELWGGRTHRRKSCYEQQGACRPSRGRAWSAAAAPPPGPPESLPPQTPGQGASGMQEAVEGVVGRLQVKEHLAHLGVI